ncbi:MAG: extracellular solute-binding protein [Lachnospiraceae bacterium]|nr:extracellular solute-binding protein [Lachnospiraceae bacterium]
MGFRQKRVGALLLCGALLASLFSGCAEKEEKQQEMSHKLTVYVWDKNFNEPAMKAAEADYREHVDQEFSLEIETYLQSSDVEDVVTIAGSCGNYSTLPDIVLFQDHYIQRYIEDYPDAWIDLEDAGIDWSDFGEEKICYSTIDGIHYGVPVDNGTVVAAYRVDILEQCGYSISDLTGVTWQRFIEIGEDIYNKTGKYLLSADGELNDLPSIMLQAEGKSQFQRGEAYLSDNETMVEVINIIDEMLSHKVLYLAENWKEYTEETIGEDMVAGVINGNWILPTIQQVEENSGKWAITSLPTIKGEEGYASNGGSSLYITANCENIQLAKDFLAYTFGGSSETYDNALIDGGVITTCISAGKSDVYKRGVPYFNNIPIYAIIVDMSSHVPVVEQNQYHYKCREYVSKVVYDTSKKNISVQKALQTAQENLQYDMEQ